MMALRTEKLLRHSADARRVEGSCAERLPSILDGTQGRHFELWHHIGPIGLIPARLTSPGNVILPSFAPRAQDEMLLKVKRPKI